MVNRGVLLMKNNVGSPVRVHYVEAPNTGVEGSMLSIFIYEGNSLMWKWSDPEDFVGKPDDLFYIGEMTTTAGRLVASILPNLCRQNQVCNGQELGFPVNAADMGKCFFGRNSTYIRKLVEIRKEVYPDLSKYCAECKTKCCSKKALNASFPEVTNLRPEDMDMFLSSAAKIPFSKCKEINGYLTFSMKNTVYALPWSDSDEFCRFYKEGLCTVQDRKPFACTQFVCQKVDREANIRYYDSIANDKYRAVTKILKTPEINFDFNGIVAAWKRVNGCEYLADLLSFLAVVKSRLNLTYINLQKPNVISGSEFGPSSRKDEGTWEKELDKVVRLNHEQLKKGSPSIQAVDCIRSGEAALMGCLSKVVKDRIDTKNDDRPEEAV